MAGGTGFLAQLGERLGLRPGAPSERDLMVTQLGTRDGRESLMQEAVRGGAPEASPERRDVLQAMIGFHGRNELFMEARTAASRAGRPFEEFGEGELKRYNALETGRPVGPHAPGGPAEGSARDQVLEGLSTRDGRAAFLGGFCGARPDKKRRDEPSRIAVTRASVDQEHLRSAVRCRPPLPEVRRRRAPAEAAGAPCPAGTEGWGLRNLDG